MSQNLMSNEAAKFLSAGFSKTAVRTNDMSMASNVLSISAESVSFAAGAAGTTGMVGLDKAPIYDSTGSGIGSTSDTSFAWVTGTVLTTEVAYNDNYSDIDFLATLSNGEFAVNYDTGRIYYKKATTGTSDTCNYKTRQVNVEVTTAASIASSIKIEDGVTATNKADVNAANTARTTATKVLAVQAIGADGTVPPTGSLVTNAPFAKLSDGTSPVGTLTNPLHVTTETAQGNLPQALGTVASGTDIYQTVLTTSAARHHIKMDLTGANDAIVSLDGGTTDHVYLSANTSTILDDLLITTTTALRAKNAVGGSNHGKLVITAW